MGFERENYDAWNYNVYEFWVKKSGLPSKQADRVRKDPIASLKKFGPYFQDVKGKKIANICGSCGKKAIPLAVLGAEVTIFDISEDSKKYALETAEYAEVSIDYVLEDVLKLSETEYVGQFDIVFMEGGILHYFPDLKRFMKVMHQLLKPNGVLLCSDFHPVRKIVDINWLGNENTGYFNSDIQEVEMPHAKFFEEPYRSTFPKCYVTLHKLSDILNAIINTPFNIIGFDEFPAWTNENLPGEFLVKAVKNK